MRATNETRSSFEALLPRLQRAIAARVRKYPGDWQELRQSAVCLSWQAYCALAVQGRLDVAKVTPLADYSVRQAVTGRNVGGSLNSEDVSSSYAQRRGGFSTTNILPIERRGDEWREGILADDSANPAAIVQALLDFAQWLESLPTKIRAVAEILSVGESTKTAAALVGVTPGRISQMRRELADSWARLMGDTLD